MSRPARHVASEDRTPRHGSSARAFAKGPPGVWSRQVLTVIVPTGLVPGSIAYLCGPDVLGLGWMGLALVAVTGLLCVGFLAHRGLGYFDSDYFQPMRRMLDDVDGSDTGLGVERVSEDGAPLVRALAQRINRASALVSQRERMSQANLVSVEGAFDRVHSVLQSLTEAVMLIDGDGRLSLANPTARRVLIDDGKPVEGRDLMELLAEELRDPVAAGLAHVEEVTEQQFQVTGLPLNERFYDLSIVPVPAVQNQEPCTLVTLIDVTRNYEIYRLKDEFLSSISHELRTPLTNICSFTEILSQVTPESESDWREFLSIVTVESERLTRILDDILEHSRLQTGQAEYDLDNVDLGSLAGAVVELFEVQAESRGIGIEFAVEGEDLVVHADRVKLGGVLSRLLDNALKFTDDGGRVRIELTSLGDAVELAVGDSGKGIPVEHRETVFERFRQIGDHLTDKPRGTGLGLPICRGFIDGMGGAMWCEDSELGGAKLRVILPVPGAALPALFTPEVGHQTSYSSARRMSASGLHSAVGSARDGDEGEPEDVPEPDFPVDVFGDDLPSTESGTRTGGYWRLDDEPDDKPDD